MRVLALLVACAACTSSAAKQARGLYDAGDFKGAAALADKELASRPKDDALWRVRVRSALALGDAKGLATAYERYHAALSRDDKALLVDLATATLGQGLRSTSTEVRVQAIGFVEDLELEPLARDVMDQMEADDDRVAAAAAVAVLRGHPQAPYLLDQLQHSDDPAARAIAITGIGRKVGEHAADDLRKAVADPDPGVRIAAIGALTKLTDDVTTRSIAEAQNDPDDSVRAAAARALAVRGLGDVKAYAWKAVNDQAVVVRLAGVALLGASKNRTGLIALARGRDPAMALQAAVELRGIESEAATAAITTALASPDPAVRAGAINAMDAVLGKGGAMIKAQVALNDTDVMVRLAAARLLAHQGQQAVAVPVFLAALDGPERLAAAADLALFGDSRGYAALTQTLLESKKPAEKLRAIAMHATAPRITPGLVAALADPSGQVRVVAAHRIVKLTRAKPR